MRKSTALTYVHWILTAVLLLGVGPAFRWVGLEFIFDWPRLLATFWVSLTLRSLFVAVLLCIAAFPLKQTLVPFWQRCTKDKPRLLLIVLFVPFMLWQFGLSVGLMLVVDVLAFLEILDRVTGTRRRMRMATAIVVPAAYFFVGLILVFCYNDVIASVEDVGKYTMTYKNLDSILLGGHSVSGIAHAVMQRLPISTYSVLEVVYFGMFGQLGAGIFFTALAYGKRHSLAYVGTLVTAYYLALLVFVLWPATDPSSICVDHFARFPQFLDLYDVQKAAVLKPHILLMHTAQPAIEADYYITFPCMHIALPVIVLWFVRRWKRMVVVLAVYDVILCMAILLLEQHFLVDLIGGVITAAVAIALVKLPEVTEGKNVGHGEGTTRGAKGTGIITSLCLMCFLWFLSAFATVIA